MSVLGRSLEWCWVDPFFGERKLFLLFSGWLMAVCVWFWGSYVLFFVSVLPPPGGCVVTVLVTVLVTLLVWSVFELKR